MSNQTTWTCDRCHKVEKDIPRLDVVRFVDRKYTNIKEYDVCTDCFKAMLICVKTPLAHI